MKAMCKECVALYGPVGCSICPEPDRGRGARLQECPQCKNSGGEVSGNCQRCFGRGRIYSKAINE
jgi:hypothetical protein